MTSTVNRPSRLEARVDKQKLYIFAAAMPALYAVLYFVLNVDRVQMILFGVMIAIALAYAVKELLRNDVRVVIDQCGVLDKRSGMGLIAWKDITGIYVTDLNGVPHICLQVVNEKQYLANRSTVVVAALKFNKHANNISPFHINTGVLDTGADEIYDAINNWLGYYSSPKTQVPEAELVA